MSQARNQRESPSLHACMQERGFLFGYGSGECPIIEMRRARDERSKISTIEMRQTENRSAKSYIYRNQRSEISIIDSSNPLCPKRPHCIYDCNYRYADIRKYSFPHGCKSKCTQHQHDHLYSKCENDIFSYDT